MSCIEDFYIGKCVFITGATGFLGKVLLEKILRSCSGVKRIYVLARARADQTPQQRMDRILQSKLFQKVRESPQLVDKVTAIKGDIAEPGLGMSEEDRAIISNNAQIVFHSAATVRFDEELRTALQINVKGTEEMVQLCKETKNLEVLVHVSSTYANCDRDFIEEKIYPPTVEPEKLFSSLEWMTDKMVNALTPALIDKRPNTYTFTKSLAEHVLSQQATDIPVAIFRPSIIGASVNEPFPGWVDNFNGPSGLFVMAGKGMLRSMRGDLKAISDIIPVDIAVNMLICVAWKTGTMRSDCIPVYNCCSGTINPVTWGKLSQLMMENIENYPLEDVFRRPNFEFESQRLRHFYWTYISHKIPAVIADAMTLLIGKKPRMNRLYSKLDKTTDVLTAFTMKEWHFSTTNNLKLLEELTPEDKKVFNFDIRDFDWTEYLKNFLLGIKTFLLKEDTANLHKAQRRIRKLRNIRWSMYALMFMLFTWILIKKVPSVRDFSFKILMRARVIFRALEPLMIVN